MTTGPEHTSILPIEPDRQSGSSTYGSGSVSTRPAPDFSQNAVLGRQKEKSGGLKFGSCFFGWVVATALTSFLLAVATGIAAAVTLSDGTPTPESLAADLQTIGVLGAIVAGVILFLCYVAGGYVAGRMARFSGAKQGVGVWLWAVVISIILGVVGYFVGRDMTLPYGVSVPRFDLTSITFNTAGIITLAVVILLPLIGAILGGLAGMPYHRRADRAGWTIDEPEA